MSFADMIFPLAQGEPPLLLAQADSPAENVDSTHVGGGRNDLIGFGTALRPTTARRKRSPR